MTDGAARLRRLVRLNPDLDCSSRSIPRRILAFDGNVVDARTGGTGAGGPEEYPRGGGDAPINRRSRAGRWFVMRNGDYFCGELPAVISRLHANIDRDHRPIGRPQVLSRGG